MKYQLKGIIRGSFSEFQAEGIEESAVINYVGDTLHEVLEGLALDEWIFILRVNGRRIKDVLTYIKRRGLEPKEFVSV